MRKRWIHIGIRVTPEEYERLKRKIREAGLTQREYLLFAALNQPVVNTDGIKALLPEMKRQGNNLNQLAKKMNHNNMIQDIEFAETMEEVRETWRSLRRRLRTLP